MARGNEILVSCYPDRKVTEGYAAGALKPGMIVQIDASVALKSGRHTYKVATPGADGGLPHGGLWVVNFDGKIGMTAAGGTFAAGDRIEMIQPAKGDEINLMFGDTAGTADDIALDDDLIVQNATGKVIKSSGSPAVKVAVALEAIVDPVADQLIWTQWSA